MEQLCHQHQAHQVVASRHHRSRRATTLTAQISANLFANEELVDLIAESGGKWIFIGMESIDPANLADVTSFNKPNEYAARPPATRAAQYLMRSRPSYLLG